MFRILSLLSLGLFLNLSVSAQLTSYKLSDYALPDFERSSLDGTFSLNSSGYNINQYYLNYYSSSYGSGYGNYYESSNRYKHNSLYGYTNLQYNHMRNNSSVQQISQISLNLAGHKSKSEDGTTDKSIDSDRYLYSYLRVNKVYRWYYSGKNFLGIHADGHYNYYNSKYEDIERGEDYDNKSTTKKIDHDLEITVPIKLGKGRIEQVQDAVRALYMVDALQKTGSVKATLSNDEITELASFIAQLRRQRYFDYRLQRIREYTALDSFLRENEILEKSDVEYYAALSDMWLYANIPARGNGYRVSLNINPTYAFDYYENDEQDVIQKKQFQKVAFQAEFTYEKPVNLKWQQSAHLYIEAAPLKTKYEKKGYDFLTSQKSLAMQANGSYGFGYYPNTRTQINLSALGVYTQVNYQSGSSAESSLEGKAYTYGAAFDLYYYISPRLRWSAYVTITKDWQGRDNTFNVVHSQADYGLMQAISSSPTYLTNHEFQYSLNTSLSYAIF